MKYQWPYLIDNKIRGERLRALSFPYVSGKGVVVDFMCGYSPLREYLADCEFVGFDNSKEAGEFLREKYPNDRWFTMTDDEFMESVNLENVETFLHLGICNEDKDYVSKKEGLNSVKCIEKFNPKCVVLEVSCKDRGKVFDYIMSEVVGMGYILYSYEIYSMGVDDESKNLRLLAVFNKDVR